MFFKAIMMLSQLATAPTATQVVVPLWNGLTTASTPADIAAMFPVGSAKRIEPKKDLTIIAGFQATPDCKLDRVRIIHKGGTVSEVQLYWNMRPSCTRDVKASLEAKYGIAGAVDVTRSGNALVEHWGWAANGTSIEMSVLSGLNGTVIYRVNPVAIGKSF